jgi:hypothetical protein
MVGDYRDVLRLMKSALAKLDEAQAPADIGAHLDMAICRLEETIDQALTSVSSGPPRENERNGPFERTV